MNYGLIHGFLSAKPKSVSFLMSREESCGDSFLPFLFLLFLYYIIGSLWF